MRRLIALFALVGFLGLSAFVHAADAPANNNKRAPHRGVFEKLDGKDIVYKGGQKGTGKEWKLPTDDKTKVVIDGKDALLSDLKEGEHLRLTVSKEGVITKVEAEAPKEKSSGSK